MMMISGLKEQVQYLGHALVQMSGNAEEDAIAIQNLIAERDELLQKLQEEVAEREQIAQERDELLASSDEMAQLKDSLSKVWDQGPISQNVILLSLERFFRLRDISLVAVTDAFTVVCNHFTSLSQVWKL
jgi:SMC interacting uncharacterized protein involved in chromosome segregation